MNDQYQHDHVNAWEKDQYQPEPVISAENDPYQPEPEKPLENEQFYEKPLETSSVQAPVDTAEPAQPAGAPEEKTETWKTTFPAPTGQVSVPAPAANPDMLLDMAEIQRFRARWNEVQAKFVDEPGASVREADTLVAEVMEQISQMFAAQRHTLEGQWSKGNTSTEDLRQVLQSYRTFFNRLLK